MINSVPGNSLKRKMKKLQRRPKVNTELHADRKKLENELAAVKTAFSNQFSNGNRKNLQNRINAANKKIKNLEEELRKKPNTPTPTPSPNKPNTPTPSPNINLIHLHPVLQTITELGNLKNSWSCDLIYMSRWLARD